MIRPSWLKQIQADLKDILELVDNCEEPYKQKCFEILLTHAVESIEMSAGGGALGKDKLGMGIKPASGRFQSFLLQHKLSEQDVGRLVDLSTGDILVTALGTKKAEVQRKLAMLIAIFHFAKDGSMLVPKDDLKAKCEQFGVYDRANFAAYMKKAKTNKTVVFLEDKVGWKVTSPAAAYVAETIKELLK